MGNALVRARICKVSVRFNGDLNDAKTRSQLRKAMESKRKKIEDSLRSIEKALRNNDDERVKAEQREINKLRDEIKQLSPEKDNTIVAKLDYPRSGSSSIMAMMPADLKNENTPAALGSDDFFHRGLFKEEVQGETQLQVTITDRDRRNKVWIYLRKVLAGIFSTASGDAIGGIAEVVLSGTASTISSSIEDKLEGSDDKTRTTTIAQSKKVQIEIDDNSKVVVLNADGTNIRFKDDQLTLRLLATEDLIISKPKAGGGKGSKIRKGASNGEIVLHLAAEPL